MRKLTEKIGTVIVCAIVIVFQILKLLTWTLPYPYDIRLILFLYEQPWLSLLNISTFLSVIITIGFVILFLKGDMNEEID